MGRAGRLASCSIAGMMLAVAASCSSLSPEPVTGEVKMLVLSYDSTAGKYRLVVGRLTTLTHLRTMEGDAAKILGGAEITVDYDELARENPQTAEAIEKLTVRTPGQPVDFAWFEADGILHPEDFHSLNIATTYFNFEKAHLYFANLGAALYGLPVNYFPVMKEGTAANLQELHDNAFWDPIVKTFAILPFKDIEELPLGMNAGVVAHEYAHAVFSNRVFPGDGIPWLYASYLKDPEKWSRALNFNRSVNEGLADFFGAVVSGDPAFIRKSMSPLTQSRRLDPHDPRCYTREIEESANTDLHARYDPYPLGSVLAAALWDAVRDRPDRQAAFSRGLVDAMVELGARFDEKKEAIELSDCLDAIASTFVADLKPEACGLFLDRFRLSPQAVPSCAESRPPGARCR